MTVRVRVTFPSSGTCAENRGDYDLYDTLYKAPVTLGRGKWIAKTMVKDFVAIPDPKISSRVSSFRNTCNKLCDEKYLSFSTALWCYEESAGKVLGAWR